MTLTNRTLSVTGGFQRSSTIRVRSASPTPPTSSAVRAASRRVIAGQKVGRGCDPTHLFWALPVARLIGGERESEPFGPSFLVPHLWPTERLGQMVVLNAGEVPHQPGDGVGVPAGPPPEHLVVGAVEDVFHLVADPLECIDQDNRGFAHACILSHGDSSCLGPHAVRTGVG